MKNAAAVRVAHSAASPVSALFEGWGTVAYSSPRAVVALLRRVVPGEFSMQFSKSIHRALPHTSTALPRRLAGVVADEARVHDSRFARFLASVVARAS